MGAVLNKEAAFYAAAKLQERAVALECPIFVSQLKSAGTLQPNGLPCLMVKAQPVSSGARSKPRFWRASWSTPSDSGFSHSI
jgi:hypothetical protein